MARLTDQAEADAKSPFIASAFTGWQIAQMLAGIAGDTGADVPSFAEYLRQLGLTD